MSLGAFACASKKMLCATVPNAKVTVSPVATVSEAGENTSDGAASTVALAAGGGGVLPYGPVDPSPQPSRSMSAMAGARGPATCTPVHGTRDDVMDSSSERMGTDRCAVGSG